MYTYTERRHSQFVSFPRSFSKVFATHLLLLFVCWLFICCSCCQLSVESWSLFHHMQHMLQNFCLFVFFLSFFLSCTLCFYFEFSTSLMLFVTVVVVVVSFTHTYSDNNEHTRDDVSGTFKCLLLLLLAAFLSLLTNAVLHSRRKLNTNWLLGKSIYQIQWMKLETQRYASQSTSLSLPLREANSSSVDSAPRARERQSKREWERERKSNKRGKCYSGFCGEFERVLLCCLKSNSGVALSV